MRSIHIQHNYFEVANGGLFLRAWAIIGALLLVLTASAQPGMYRLMGRGAATNSYIFVDSASARPTANNEDTVKSPARDYTNATILFAQVADYPTPANTPGVLTDNKGNTYTLVMSPTINNLRVRYYMCFNPVLTGGGVILTYSSTVTIYPVIFVQAYRGVTTLPTYATNSATSTLSISSISTNSVTTTVANSLVVSTVATQATITTAPTVSGSVTISERMNWFPLTGSRNVFAASYNSIKSGTATFSVTHTTSGVNFNQQTVAAIAAFQ